MKQDNPHAKHRQRLRERFLSTGLEGFQDHEILELALFYVYSRRDTNPIGHALIERFGSLSGVLDAPVEALRRVPGVGPQAAVFLKLLPALFARYESSKYDGVTAIGSPQEAADYILPRFIGKTDELVYLLASMRWRSTRAASAKSPSPTRAPAWCLRITTRQGSPFRPRRI